MRLLILFALVLSVGTTACTDNQECCFPENEKEIYGKWRIVEYGYSPGGGYIVKEVSEETVRWATFEQNGGFASNYQGLEDETAYRIYANPNDDAKVMGLFKTTEEADTTSFENLTHSYRISKEGAKLKLHYIGCTEGCHIGLVRD